MCSSIQLELDLELVGGEADGAEHADASGVGDGGDHVAAVGEGEDGELDAQLVADLGVHDGAYLSLWDCARAGRDGRDTSEAWMPR